MTPRRTLGLIIMVAAAFVFACLAVIGSGWAYILGAISCASFAWMIHIAASNHDAGSAQERDDEHSAP
jgi:hypothetical protein